jgi:hypothetical protein
MVIPRRCHVFIVAGSRSIKQIQSDSPLAAPAFHPQSFVILPYRRELVPFPVRATTLSRCVGKSSRLSGFLTLEPEGSKIALGNDLKYVADKKAPAIVGIPDSFAHRVKIRLRRD